MSFSIVVRPTARITNFADAERHYNQFNPIRGRTKDVTGAALCNRREWRHKSLHKLNNGDTYGFRLYNTDVVQIHRDNSITIDMGYWSLSTDRWAQVFLQHLTGKYVWVHSQHRMVYMHEEMVPDDVLATYRYEVKPSEQKDWLYFFSDTETITLTPEGDGKYRVVDPSPRFVKRVNKSGASEARKPLQPFIEYLKIFESTPLPHDAIRELQGEFTDKYGFGANALRQVAQSPDDQELWPYAAASCHMTRYHWASQHDEPYMQDIKGIKTELYKNRYEYESLNSYVKLPIGQIKNAPLYSQAFVDMSN